MLQTKVNCSVLAEPLSGGVEGSVAKWSGNFSYGLAGDSCCR